MVTFDGTRLHAERKRQKIARADLARRVAVDQSTIYRAEKNLVTPATATLARIAAELGVTLDSFFARR